MKKLLVALILLVPSTVLAQTVWPVNEQRRLGWDFTQADIDFSQTSRFEVQLDNGNWVDTGLPVLPPGTYIWPIPQLTIGTHIARVRACNANQCGPEATVNFTLVAILPPTPSNLRILPSQQVSIPQALQLAESVSYIYRLQNLSIPEINYLAANYHGNFTYSDVLIYLVNNVSH